MPYCPKCGNTTIAHKHLSPPKAVVDYIVPTWSPVREGSNIEVPNFRRFTGPSRFPLATGKSKKLYERAVARSFIHADVTRKSAGLGTWTDTRSNCALAAFTRLVARCDA